MNESNLKEIVVLTVNKKYYEENIDIFKSDNVSVKSVFVEGEDQKDDMIHKALLKNYLKAQKELRDYEFNKRHKVK